MFFIIALAFVILFLSINHLLLKMTKDRLSFEYKSLIEQRDNYSSINRMVSGKFKELEERVSEALAVYEMARDISPIVNKSELLRVFAERLKGFSDIKDIGFFSRPREGYDNYALKDDSVRYMCIVTESDEVKEYIPLFLYQLNLCLERISLYDKLQQLSIHDSLTQVYNRRYLTERINEEFERAKEFAFNLSFLMIDIDFFKKINDTYGHIVGDIVLRNVAFIIKDTVREIDIVGRYGGEEFSVVLPEESKEDAIIVAKRIVKRVASTKIRAFDDNITTTVSAGVASYPQDTMHLDMLIEIADKALYQSKNSGRNSVNWF